MTKDSGVFLRLRHLRGVVLKEFFVCLIWQNHYGPNEDIPDAPVATVITAVC